MSHKHNLELAGVTPYSYQFKCRTCGAWHAIDKYLFRNGVKGRRTVISKEKR